MKGTDLMIKEAFQRLINRDLEWLMKQPRSPERDHIEAVIKQTIDLHYERLESNKRLFDEWSARACEWLKERVQCGVHPQRAYGFAEEFRKAMEE